MTDRRFIRPQSLDSPENNIKVQCRFCKESQECSKQEIIIPCACTQPNRYVHRKCLQSWAISKFENACNYQNSNIPQEFNIICQICQQRMEISFKITKRISKYEDFMNKINNNKLLFSFLIFLTLLAIGVIAFIIIYIIYQGDEFNNLFIIVISVSGFTFLFTIIVFIRQFLVVNCIEIQNISNYKNAMIERIDEAKVNKTPIKRISLKDQIPQNYQKTDSLYEKSLKQESVKNDMQVLGSNMISKTFTDILMKKMYAHDSNNEKPSQQIELNDNIETKNKDIQKQKIDSNLSYSKSLQISVQEEKNQKFAPKSTVINNQSGQLSKNINQMGIQSSIRFKNRNHYIEQETQELPISDSNLTHNLDKQKISQLAPPPQAGDNSHEVKDLPKIKEELVMKQYNQIKLKNRIFEKK